MTMPTMKEELAVSAPEERNATFDDQPFQPHNRQRKTKVMKGDLVVSPPEVLDATREQSGMLNRDQKAFSAGPDVLTAEDASSLRIDQGLPRLLYELAVQLPAQSDIHALCVWLYEPVQHTVRLHALLGDLPSGRKAGIDFPVENSIAEWVWQHQQPLTIHVDDDTRFPRFTRALAQAGVKSFCGLPLMIANRRIGVLGLASTKPDAFHDFKLQYAQRGHVEAADSLRALQSPSNSNHEPMYLEEEVRPEDKFDDIIGRSASLRAALDQIKIVAPTNSTVLILGETGTGKELIARALHNRSSRRDKPFIKVNCAAMPSGLLESELFGHERGAFTGAIMRKLGRFELANGGTLFLDEIGDIPAELQPKLLRILQEQEFERLGSTQTTRVDVRIVAATSRDLPQMVANREFRSDLYYRLNVFPVRLPALRERPEDIPLLARHFVDTYAERMNKSVEHIPVSAMKVISDYPWPGNVRELQNFIERAVILSPGTVLRAPLLELEQARHNLDSGASDLAGPTTLKDAEREHIIQALADTGWVIGGSRGAAARLGLPRTTLVSKMQRLGISRAQA
jgi:formate hydrogenlyase transcriptional activator